MPHTPNSHNEARGFLIIYCLSLHIREGLSGKAAHQQNATIHKRTARKAVARGSWNPKKSGRECFASEFTQIIYAYRRVTGDKVRIDLQGHEAQGRERRRLNDGHVIPVGYA